MWPISGPRSRSPSSRFVASGRGPGEYGRGRWVQACRLPRRQDRERVRWGGADAAREEVAKRDRSFNGVTLDCGSEGVIFVEPWYPQVGILASRIALTVGLPTRLFCSSSSLNISSPRSIKSHWHVLLPLLSCVKVARQAASKAKVVRKVPVLDSR